MPEAYFIAVNMEYIPPLHRATSVTESTDDQAGYWETP